MRQRKTKRYKIVKGRNMYDQCIAARSPRRRLEQLAWQANQYHELMTKGKP